MTDYNDLFESALADPRARNLSEAAQQQRTALGSALGAQVVRRRRRREAVRASAALALIAVTVGLLFRDPAATPEPTELPPVARPQVETVRNRPGLLARVLVTAEQPRFTTTIEDGELLDLLAATGHESGILRTGGRFLLTEPLALAEAPDEDD